MRLGTTKSSVKQITTEKCNDGAREYCVDAPKENCVDVPRENCVECRCMLSTAGLFLKMFRDIPEHRGY